MRIPDREHLSDGLMCIACCQEHILRNGLEHLARSIQQTLLHLNLACLSAHILQVDINKHLRLLL